MIECNKEMWIPRMELELTHYLLENIQLVPQIIKSFKDIGQQQPIVLVANPFEYFPNYNKRSNLPKLIWKHHEFPIVSGNDKIFAIDSLGIEEVKVVFVDSAKEVTRLRKEQAEWWESIGGVIWDGT